jgi:hypothetical protein
MGSCGNVRVKRWTGHECSAVIALEPYGTGFNDCCSYRASCSASFDSARTWPAQDWNRPMGKAEHDYALRHLAYRNSAGDPYLEALTRRPDHAQCVLAGCARLNSMQSPYDLEGNEPIIDSNDTDVVQRILVLVYSGDDLVVHVKLL